MSWTGSKAYVVGNADMKYQISQGAAMIIFVQGPHILFIQILTLLITSHIKKLDL